MTLIVEDGSIVPDANTFVGVQGAAAFHAERGGLIPVWEIVSAAVTFGPGGVITAPAGTFANFTAQSIVEVRGAAQPENSGFGHLRSASGTQLVAVWLDTVDEAPGAEVTITLFEQAGWWHAWPRRLEGSLINAATFEKTRYGWAGLPVQPTQPLPWPRKDVWLPPLGTPQDSPSQVFATAQLFFGTGASSDTWYRLPVDVIPQEVINCQLWLSQADIEAPLLATIDPADYLVSKELGTSGIKKTFDGKIRLRRFPQADGEVYRYLADAVSSAGPTHRIERV